MKLISNLDVNGNNFINGSLTLQMPDTTGTKTIATTDDLAQFGGAFQFKGTAIRIKADTNPANTTIVVAGPEDPETHKPTEVEIVAAAANSGNVYQIEDKEYASNGTVWVELGFNIDLSDYLTISDAADTYLTISNAEETYLTISDAAETYLTMDDAADTYLTIDDAADTYLAQDDFEEASEVISAALNDLNSRTTDIESELDDVIKGVKLSDSESALTPDANQVVTIPNATTSADGLMSSEDKTKLDGIASGAEANVQADWAESDSSSDAYIANKPTNLAVTAVYEPTEAQYIAKSVSLNLNTLFGAACYWPMVQVYFENEIVSATVTVSEVSGSHHVTVSWAVNASAEHPIHIRVVACPTEPVQAPSEPAVLDGGGE